MEKKLISGGMFALGAKTQDQFTKSKRIRHMEIAEGLTHTCHESYDRTPTKLGPETFHFIEGNEARSLKSGEKYYILRPEVNLKKETKKTIINLLNLINNKKRNHLLIAKLLCHLFFTHSVYY